MQARTGATTPHVLAEMPEEKEEKGRIGLRLSDGALQRLEWLAEQLEVGRGDVVDLALKHLQGTLSRELGVWVSDPPPSAKKSPGGPRDAA